MSVQQPYLGSLDDAIVAVIEENAFIRFGALLREMARRVGCNKINEETLQRRLKGLRFARRIRYNRMSPKGWILTDDERNRKYFRSPTAHTDDASN